MRQGHPSGRPIADDHVVSIDRNMPRPPREDYLTPRMRQGERVSAIGFMSSLRVMPNDDE